MRCSCCWQFRPPGPPCQPSADRIVDDAVRALFRLLGGAEPECFHFAGSGSAAVEWCLKLVARPGSHVITGNLDHRAVWAPLRGWQEQGSISVSSICCDANGYYRPEDVATAIDRNTSVVALTHASNVLGTIQPIAAIADLCRQRGVPLLVDASQTAGIVPVNIGELGIDLLAASGHKGLLGPMGVGFFYVSSELTRRLPSPWLRDDEWGGLDAAAGTANVVGLAGLAAGIDFLIDRGIDAQWRREQQLGHARRRIVTESRSSRCLAGVSRWASLGIAVLSTCRVDAARRRRRFGFRVRHRRSLRPALCAGGKSVARHNAERHAAREPRPLHPRR